MLETERPDTNTTSAFQYVSVNGPKDIFFGYAWRCGGSVLLWSACAAPSVLRAEEQGRRFTAVQAHRRMSQMAVSFHLRPRPTMRTRRSLDTLKDYAWDEMTTLGRQLIIMLVIEVRL